MSEERYQIKKKLSEGGAGSVYVAHDTRLDRDVALKRLMAGQSSWSQEAVESMLKEARTLSSISHPNIVTIYDAGVDDVSPYVVMELLKGRNIDDLVAESTLTADDFIYFAVQCLEALTASHALNLIHRDIKPNNIVLKWLPSGKFQAKLLDFGLAKFTKEPTKQTVDQTDSVLGSIYFMAPEQFERTELDARTDLYALGSVFYYTLSGLYPFTGKSPADVMTAHLTHRVKPLSEHRSDLPEWLSHWVMWMINRDMGHRPQSAQEALDLFHQNSNAAPLKSPSAATSKFNKEAESHYFGQSSDNTSFINKNAAKADQSVEVMAPVLLNSSGQLIIGREQDAPITPAIPTTAAPSPTQISPPPSNTSNLSQATPFGKTVASPKDGVKAKPKSKTKLFSLLSVIGIALIVGGSLLIYRLEENKKVAQINALLSPVKEGLESIPTNGEDIDLLLSQLYSVSGNVKSDLIYRRLSVSKSADKKDIDFKISRFATQSGDDIIPKVREALFRVLGARKGESSLPIITEFIHSHPNDQVVATAIEATKDLVKASDLGFLTDIIINTDSADKRKAAEIAASSLLRNSTERRILARKLKAALPHAKGAMAKATLTRLLGILGGNQAKEIIEESLSSSRLEELLPALGALKDWPDGSMTQTAIDYWNSSTEPNIRKVAFDTAFNLMKRHHMNTNAQSQKLWSVIIKNANNNREKMRTLVGLAATKEQFAIPLISPLTKDSNKGVANKARGAIKHIQRTKKKK